MLSETELENYLALPREEQFVEVGRSLAAERNFASPTSHSSMLQSGVEWVDWFIEEILCPKCQKSDHIRDLIGLWRRFRRPKEILEIAVLAMPEHSPPIVFIRVTLAVGLFLSDRVFEKCLSSE